MRYVDMESSHKSSSSGDPRYHDTIPAPPSCDIDIPKVDPLPSLDKWTSGDVIVTEDDDID